MYYPLVYLAHTHSLQRFVSSVLVRTVPGGCESVSGKRDLIMVIYVDIAQSSSDVQIMFCFRTLA